MHAMAGILKGQDRLVDIENTHVVAFFLQCPTIWEVLL